MSGAGARLGAAQWLSLGDGPIYSVLHTPEADVARRSTAVLIVPPFGWDEILCHRARRFWAIALADAGFPALRIDLPGTAESHGDAHQPGLVDRWVRAVGESGRWLRVHTGASRLAVIAIGTGGLVSLQALADGAPIDDLVLWAVKGKGRAAARELVAYANVVASEHPDDADGPAPEDGVDVTGFLLSGDTMAALSEIDAAALEVSEPEARRVLLLSRDELGVDEHLHGALMRTGMAVESVEVSDYRELMTHPQAIDARRPTATIALTEMWLSEAPSAGTPAVGLPPAGPPRAATSHAGPSHTARIASGHGHGPVTETILNLSLGGEAAVAVVSGPDESTARAPLSALLLNSGALHKDGPHRMWVELARRWADRGITTVRADIGAVGDAAGIGDSGEDERPAVTTEALTSPAMLELTHELIRTLRERGIVDRLVIVGHCSGGYIGLHEAVNEDGIEALLAIDQPAFDYSDELVQERMFERIVSVAREGIFKRLRDQGLSATEVRQVLDAVRHRYGRGRGDSAEAEQLSEGLRLLDQLRDSDVKVLLLFTREGPLHDEVFSSAFQSQVQEGRWPNAEIEELPTTDHMARAVWLQKLTHARLDLELDELLAGLEPARGLAPAS